MELIIDFFTESDLLSIFLKLFGIVIGLLYLFFSIIMIKQVESMKRTVTIDDGGLLIFLSYLQVAFAALIVFAAIFII